MQTLNPPRKNIPSPKEIIPRAFPGISQLEIDELVARAEVKNFAPGFTLCHEGAEEAKFYILIEGKVDVTKIINNSEQRHLKSLDAGAFFGEMALIHNAPRAASVVAASHVTVLEIDKENFDRVLQRSASVSRAMVREISGRLRENDEMAVEDLRMRASELAQAYQKLAEQEFARREFLSNVAYELRTPLMTASGFLQLIQTGAIPPDKIPGATEMVAKSVQQIAHLVNDILFLQEMDLILPKFQTVDIVPIAQEVAQTYKEKAAASQVTIDVNADPNLPNISGDSKSLERALTALVDNAVKFSRHGGRVEINIHEDRNDVLLDVVDQGIGIDPERISHIFDRFYHAERNDQDLFGGIGLGLSITNQVIKQHNGSLSVQSKAGKGSTFTVRLKAMKVVL
ncbi:MAG: ATP-binding protein [Anaerolineales bacterium]